MNAIVRRCPAQQVRVEHGVVHVYSRLARHPRNILNLRIWRFELKNGNVFDADHELRLIIDMELHPEKYAGGYNGGYGYPPDNVFAIPNVSFSARNSTVRNVLDGIIKANGNALWLARTSGTALSRRAPLSRTYKDREAISTIWDFLPLNDSQ